VQAKLSAEHSKVKSGPNAVAWREIGLHPTCMFFSYLQITRPGSLVNARRALLCARTSACRPKKGVGNYENCTGIIKEERIGFPPVNLLRLKCKRGGHTNAVIVRNAALRYKNVCKLRHVERRRTFATKGQDICNIVLRISFWRSLIGNFFIFLQSLY